MHALLVLLLVFLSANSRLGENPRDASGLQVECELTAELQLDSCGSCASTTAECLVASSNATGFLGHRGFELANHSGQPVRNVATQIGERVFKGHALDQMQNRGIVPSVVENAITNGLNSAGNRPFTTRHFDAANNVTVILNELEQVITVFFGGG